jgi:hypothetical protein
MTWGQADSVAEKGLMTPIESADLGEDRCAAVGCGGVVEQEAGKLEELARLRFGRSVELGRIVVGVAPVVPS